MTRVVLKSLELFSNEKIQIDFYEFLGMKRVERYISIYQLPRIILKVLKEICTDFDYNQSRYNKF